MKYFYFWIFWIVIRALINGFKAYRVYRKAGYNTDWYKKTGEKIKFDGGFWEAVSSTISGALGLIFSPYFLLMETLYFIPASIVLYIIS